MSDFTKESCPWPDYPRPQFKRDSFFNLNGKWDLSVRTPQGLKVLGEILVPYPPESEISGIKRNLRPGERYVYSRKFTLPRDFTKDIVLLHFGAVDQIAEIQINDLSVGSHVGGYIPFSFDITNFLNQGENTITVTVTDDLNRDLPYGKQRRDRGGMWYTPISGIWQTVWIESLPAHYIRGVKIETEGNRVHIVTSGGLPEKSVFFNGLEYKYKGDSIEFTVQNPVMWTPETPRLYDFEIVSGEDSVASYFAFREVSVQRINGKSYIAINGKPCFFHGLLDQGYFADGIYTPASPEEYKRDILSMKSLGFNTLRKHIKIEPDLFYHYCDKYGMFVFQDMVNSGRYNFFIDTALPTLGLKRGISHSASKFRSVNFEQTAFSTAKLLYNHPSVVYYTIFNEGWGQYDADRVYGLMKDFDSSRIWDATSGWFFEKLSDVTSEHVYFKPIRIKAHPDRPLVLSEFGGYSYKIPEHSFNLQRTYGYRFFTQKDEFCSALQRLYLDEIIPAIKQGLCAAILTQVSDVEDETNGLLTYDRKVLKVDEALMREVSAALYTAFEQSI